MNDLKSGKEKEAAKKKTSVNRDNCQRNTYQYIWLFRIIAVVICLRNLYLFFHNKDFFLVPSYSKYSVLMYRREFWLSFHPNIMTAAAVMLLAAVCIYVAAARYVKRNRVMGVYLDIAGDLAVAVTLAGYLLLLLYCGRSYIKFEKDTVIYFFSIGLMLLILSVHIWVYKRNAKIFSREISKYEKIIFVSLGCVVTAIAVIFDLRGFGAYLSFRGNYGIYDKIDHKRYVEMEDDWGNYRNDAVNADGEIYYVDNMKSNDGIMHIDETGEIQPFFELDKDQGDIREICYDAGWIYADIYHYGDNDRIIRVNTDTKEVETVVEADYILTMKIKDRYLYYECRNNENPDSRYIFDIYRIPLDGVVSMESRELYIGCVDGSWQDEWRDFHIIYMYDYYDYDAVSTIEYQRYQQYYEGYTYVLKEGDYGSWGEDAGQIKPTDLWISKDGTENQIRNVIDYNIYEGVLYYAVIRDDGVDVYSADLYGSKAEIIASYDYKVWGGRLIVGDHYIVCVWMDWDVNQKLELIDK